jgi:hypothetical protein
MGVNAAGGAAPAQSSADRAFRRFGLIADHRSQSFSTISVHAMF